MACVRKWIVTTAPDRPLSEIIGDLTAAGFMIDTILEELGIVTGEAGDDTAQRLREIPGVTDVSADYSVDIGPPDSPETW
ncbi:hypothetical protein [Nocardia bovistercoris]|uniref:Ketohydroxyglutarate aldolase n=1 Tax=Nocardia bovistercoris TaxID=2785916 RepID=A0A931IE20_9NOCA|nr:hypothetical protein [Nocardia bovistercoris]MBH0779486.1 hypothetical protein [Nocardia bovistercoris]